MWLVVMCASYCLNLSAIDIEAKNPIWNLDRGYLSLLVYHTKGFKD